MSILDYSISNLYAEYKKNSVLVHAYCAGSTVENLKDSSIMGLTVGVFVVVLIVSLVFWIAGIYLLSHYWNSLPMWVKIIGVLGVIPGVPLGPVVTVVLVLVFKNEAKASKPALTVPEA
jgi:hypothetical protein